eukprot:6384953-Karenia_brevis.AAC.1
MLKTVYPPLNAGYSWDQLTHKLQMRYHGSNGACHTSFLDGAPAMASAYVNASRRNASTSTGETFDHTTS